jgi:hypothetical protein
MSENNLPERYGKSQQLTLDFLGSARQTLETLREPEDLTEFLERAQAFAYLAEKAKLAEEVQREAHEIVLRTRRAIGELEEQAPKPERARSAKGQFGPDAPRARVGLSRGQLADAKKVAAVPKEQFEEYATEAPRPTTRGLLATTVPSVPEPPKLSRAEQEAEVLRKMSGRRSSGAEVAEACGADARDVARWLHGFVVEFERHAAGYRDEGDPKKGLAPGRGPAPTQPLAPKKCAHAKTRISPTTGLRLCEGCGDVLRR